MKYKKEYALKAFKLIVEEAMDNMGLCNALGIDIVTFYIWTNHNYEDYQPEFAEWIEKAHVTSKEMRKQEALASIRKMASGFRCEESTIEYKEGQEVRKLTKKKEQAPNLRAALVLLEHSNDPFI